MSFLSMLAILFIGLKLAGIIAWSWWLVLLPLYLGLAIVGVLIIIMVITGGTAITIDAIFRNKKKTKFRL